MLNSPEYCPGAARYALALSELYYFINAFSNFMKSCFIKDVALHISSLAQPGPTVPGSHHLIFVVSLPAIIYEINIKLKPFSFIIILPMRFIPICIFNN
ncbi:hypothetical protein C0Q87_10445 [Klebsiella aerogenes]|nr:hypothetical protein F0333_03035 [Klebsiella aerogenes]PLC38512.1 hypothetical protein C0Q87_10445 [Klebsiella aerogenes]